MFKCVIPKTWYWVIKGGASGAAKNAHNYRLSMARGGSPARFFLWRARKFLLRHTRGGNGAGGRKKGGAWNAPPFEFLRRNY